MELTKELGPKVGKTDPEKQTYGPETSEKVVMGFANDV